MARVNEGSHNFICHTLVYPQLSGMNHTCLYSPTWQPQSITALWQFDWYSFSGRVRFLRKDVS